MNYLDEIRWGILSRIMEAKGKISDAAIIEYLESIGINTNRNMVNDWRSGKSSSFIDHIYDIADFLKADVTYLKEGNRNNSGISENTLDNTTFTAYNKNVSELTADSVQVARVYQALPTNEDKNYIRRALRLPELESETEKGAS